MRFWSIFISNFRGNSRIYAVVAVSIYCLVIYPMSGNNATLRIDFTDFDSTDSTEKIKFRSVFLVYWIGNDATVVKWSVRNIRELSTKFFRPEILCKTDVHKIFAKFVEKHLCWSLFLTLFRMGMEGGKKAPPPVFTL